MDVRSLTMLRPGLNCSVKVDDPELGSEALKSRVEEYQEERLTIQWPARRGQNLNLAVGDALSLQVPTFNSRGQQGPTIHLGTEIVERQMATATSPIPLLVVKILTVGHQEQRDSFRLGLTLLPIDCAVWQRDFGASDADGMWRPINARLYDISAGGAGLLVDEELSDGARIRLRIPYPMGDGDFAAEALVTMAIPTASGPTSRFRLGTKFDNLDKFRHERLTRCIYRFQIEQSRRERSRGTFAPAG
jgi:PilZ domain